MRNKSQTCFGALLPTFMDPASIAHHFSPGSNTESVAEDIVMRILILMRNFVPAYKQVSWHTVGLLVDIKISHHKSAHECGPLPALTFCQLPRS